jgi:hypothetical protein
MRQEALANDLVERIVRRSIARIEERMSVRGQAGSRPTG